MTEPKLDAQRLAALLDGRLSGPERDHVLAQVAASDPDQEVLADAAAILAELEGEDERPPETDGVIPLRPMPGRGARSRRPGPGWLALAASVVLAILAVSPVLLSRRGGADADPARLAVLLRDPDAGLPGGWTGQRPWGATRGGTKSLTPAARGVRLGVLLLDLELAARAGQPDAVAKLAGQVEALLDDVPGAGGAASEYLRIRNAATAPPGSLKEPLERGRESVAGLVDDDAVRLGSWAEAARLAAARDDAAFFRKRETRRTLEWAAGLSFLNDPSSAAMDGVRAAADPESPDLAALRRELDELLRAAGA